VVQSGHCSTHYPKVLDWPFRYWTGATGYRIAGRARMLLPEICDGGCMKSISQVVLFLIRDRMVSARIVLDRLSYYAGYLPLPPALLDDLVLGWICQNEQEGHVKKQVGSVAQFLSSRRIAQHFVIKYHCNRDQSYMQSCTMNQRLLL